jgi:hypothetical protein
MRSSVSERAEQAQKGAPGSEIATMPWPHYRVGNYSIRS